MSIYPCTQVALVGPSGGGKSTIVALMERFYDPCKGAVTMDGAPLPAIDHAFLHQQVGPATRVPTGSASGPPNVSSAWGRRCSPLHAPARAPTTVLRR